MREQLETVWHAMCTWHRRMKKEIVIQWQASGGACGSLTVLLVTLAVALWTPAEDDSASSFEQYSFLLSSDDYITPLLTSPMAVHQLNAAAGRDIQFAGYDHFPARIETDRGPKVTDALRFTGKIENVLGIDFLAVRSGTLPANFAYISEHLWKTIFHGAVDILDRSIQVSGETYRICAVVREAPEILSGVHVWLPLRHVADFPGASFRIVLALKQALDPAEAQRRIRRYMTEMQIFSLPEVQPRLAPLESSLACNPSPEDALAAGASATHQRELI